MEENGEDAHAMQTEENVEEMKESHDAEEDAELEDGQKNVKASSKKRGKKKGSSGGQATPKKVESKEPVTPVTPASDRPARERKIIDRFADTVEKEKEKPKDFKIEQGAGTCLKDIPNVVFKLSKRKTSDESVQLLHKLLYNKRVKPYFVKANILQFSGYIWGPNEEKEKSKMKDKLEKCLKDNLYQVCDLLDLKNVTKTTKKEDVVMRVLEFLDSPHKTTDKLVQEEEQKLREKKRKSTPSKGKKKKKSSQSPRKRQKREANEDQEQGVEEDQENEDAQEEPEEEHEEEPEEEPEEVPVKKKRSIKIKEPSRDAKPSSAKKQGKKSAKKASESEDGEEDPVEPAEEPEEPEEPPEEPKRKRSKNKKYEDDVTPRSPKKVVQKSDEASKSPKKSAQKSVKKKSVYEPGEEDLDDEVPGVKSKPLSKVSKKPPPPKEDPTPVVSAKKEKKKVGTSSTKVSAKKKSKEEQEEDAPAPPTVPKKARGASNSEAKEEIKSDTIPQDEDLRAAICELLRDADFSTVTFTDVVKQLGAKFDVDLSQNKAHVKNLIQEEISKIVDEDDGEGDNEDEEAGIHTPEKKEKESIAEG